MRRSVLAATLLIAALCGGGAGVGLYAWWPHPLAGAAGHSTTSGTVPPPTLPTSSASSASATSAPHSSTTRSAASPMAPRRSPSAPTARPSAPTSSPSVPTSSPAAQPAFTRLALLTPQEFLQRGWGAARLVDRFAQIPSPAITPCAAVQPDQEGVRAGYAATYASERTEAAEVVARFDTVSRAENTFRELRAAVAGCADASVAGDRVRVVAAHHPDPGGISELRWWNTQALDGGPARGVVGVVRVDDRIAVLSLRSDVTDPADTTRIESLLVRAGRRLV